MGLRFATHIFTGAAPVSIALLQWFDRIGIEIFQAYAMTENCCYGHFNMAGANKIGTVGRPLSEIEVKLSGDGEVLIRHKALMKGYFREQALTEQAFEDGFLKTGDIGTIDSANYLTLIGRLKEQFKTDKGKLIAPTPLETLLLNCASFDQVCVVGSGLPQPIALVTLSDIAHSQNRKEVARKALHAIEEINATLGSAEKIAKVIVLHDTWTMENGLLTPTMKVKRHELERRFASRYDWWFGQPDPVVWE